MGTVLPGVIAFVVGGVLAVGVFVPWTAWEYRRRGRLGFRRSLLAFGTLVYALALLTYTLLPLPSDIAAVCRAAVSPQLRPFAFVSDIAREGGLSDPRSLLTNRAAAQILLNVVLFVPLGALVRHALAPKRVLLGLVAGLGAGFAVSLFIETTQLTGDWFLYPCAYRLFDVDDLLANTTGAVLGTLLAPLVGLFAGSTRPVDADAPRPITSARRFSGMLADVLAIGLVSAALTIGTSLAWSLGGGGEQDPVLAVVLTAEALIAPAAQLVIVLVSGRTLGEHVVRLRPTPSPRPGQSFVRWLLGSGGWAALLAFSVPGCDFAAFVIAVASIIAVWSTRSHRGFALAVLRLDIEDDRASPNL